MFHLPLDQTFLTEAGSVNIRPNSEMLKPRPMLQQVQPAADQCAVLNTPESRRVRHYFKRDPDC
jgi:hypothetical protein